MRLPIGAVAIPISTGEVNEASVDTLAIVQQVICRGLEIALYSSSNSHMAAWCIGVVSIQGGHREGNIRSCGMSGIHERAYNGLEYMREPTMA